MGRINLVFFFSFFFQVVIVVEWPTHDSPVKLANAIWPVSTTSRSVSLNLRPVRYVSPGYVSLRHINTTRNPRRRIYTYKVYKYKISFLFLSFLFISFLFLL